MPHAKTSKDHSIVLARMGLSEMEPVALVNITYLNEMSRSIFFDFTFFFILEQHLKKFKLSFLIWRVLNGAFFYYSIDTLKLKEFSEYILFGQLRNSTSPVSKGWNKPQ